MKYLVREIPVDERPREKAIKHGVNSLSNMELLAILIRTGYQGNSSLVIAENILKKSQGINTLSRLTSHELQEIKGIKAVKAVELLACFELSKRMAYGETLNKNVIENPESLIKWLNLELGNLVQENFLVVFLNVKNHILGYRILFKGTVDSSLVHPREIFKEALYYSSSRIMIVHNHPSSVLEPSVADIELTSQLCQCGEMMGIHILDHLIVSNTGFFSFKATGLL